MKYTRFSPGESEQARRTLFRYNFFNVISFVLLSGNIITLFALRMGAGSILIGILSAINYTSYAAIFIGRQLAPRLGVVRLMGRYWLFRYLAMAPILAVPLFAMGDRYFIAYALILLTVSGFSICRGIAIPGYNPIIGAITTGQDRGRFLANLQGINHTVTLLLGIVMALLLGRSAPLYIYTLFILVGIIAGIVATAFFFRIPEPEDARRGMYEGVLRAFGKALKRPAFRRFTAVHFFVSFVTFMITPFLIPYLKDVYLQPDNLVVFYTVFGSLGGIIMALVSGFLIDRLGAKPLYFLFTGIIVLTLIPLALSPTLDSGEAVIFGSLIFFFHSLGSLGVITAGQTYFFNAIEPEERLNLGALYYLTEGLGGGLGALLGGILLDRFKTMAGTPALGYSYYFMLVFMLFIGPIIMISRMERLGAYTIADTLSILFSPRDLRAIGLLHRLRKSTTLSEEKRVIKALASSPSDISVGEVLTKLRSPRYTIRVEALRALRHLPSDEREIQPLIQELKNQTYTTAHLAAEVIGKKGYDQAIPALRRQLNSQNYFLSGECMIALARLRDRESISRIRELLDKTVNPRLIIHAATALELFGDVQAVPVLLRKLERKTAPYLRDEIILSVADILQMGSWFYPLYTRFLESAREGISLLTDHARRVCEESRFTNINGVLALLTGRDRSLFASRASELIESQDIQIAGIDVSGFFTRALGDERIIRLDRFCFLAAALAVSACSK
jgi:predicted MFS family arabinose efflux permease